MDWNAVPNELTGRSSELTMSNVMTSFGLPSTQDLTLER